MLKCDYSPSGASGRRLGRLRRTARALGLAMPMVQPRPQKPSDTAVKSSRLSASWPLLSKRETMCCSSLLREVEVQSRSAVMLATRELVKLQQVASPTSCLKSYWSSAITASRCRRALCLVSSWSSWHRGCRGVELVSTSRDALDARVEVLVSTSDQRTRGVSSRGQDSNLRLPYCSFYCRALISLLQVCKNEILTNTISGAGSPRADDDSKAGGDPPAAVSIQTPGKCQVGIPLSPDVATVKQTRYNRGSRAIAVPRGLGGLRGAAPRQTPRAPARVTTPCAASGGR